MRGVMGYGVGGPTAPTNITNPPTQTQPLNYLTNLRHWGEGWVAEVLPHMSATPTPTQLRPQTPGCQRNRGSSGGGMRGCLGYVALLH